MTWNGEERRKAPSNFQEDVLYELRNLKVTVSLLSERLHKIIRFVDGNGTPERGAVVRVDRLEQKMVMVWGLVVAVGGLLLNTVVGWLTRKP